MTVFGFIFTFSPIIFAGVVFLIFVCKRFFPRLWEKRPLRFTLLTLAWAFGVVSLPILLGWAYFFVWLFAFGSSI